MTDQPKTPQPMDPGATEQRTPGDYTPRPRDAYAVTTLIAEVQALYPDVSVETFQPNGRGVSLAVMVHDDEEPDLQRLMGLLGDPATGDDRIEMVDRSPEDNEFQGYTVVEFKNSPTLYDLRDEFGLAEADKILREWAEGEVEDTEDEESKAKSGHYIYRSAITGRAVKEHYARTHPDTTVREWVEDTEEEQ